MKPEFHDEYISPDIDPLSKPMVEHFDWNELARRLGEPTEEPADQDEIDRKVAIVMRTIMQFILQVDFNRDDAAISIGRRCVAFAWVLNPDLFAGSPSLTTLAKKLGCTPGSLASVSGATTRRFGIRNRGQSHAWNRRAA